MEEQEFKTVIAPKGCFKAFTEGKEYEVIEIIGFCGKYGVSFTIKTDFDMVVMCLQNGCAHLNGGNWIIKE